MVELPHARVALGAFDQCRDAARERRVDDDLRDVRKSSATDSRGRTGRRGREPSARGRSRTHRRSEPACPASGGRSSTCRRRRARRSTRSSPRRSPSSANSSTAASRITIRERSTRGSVMRTNETLTYRCETHTFQSKPSEGDGHGHSQRPLHRRRRRRGDRLLLPATWLAEDMHPAPTFAMLSRGDLRLVLSAPGGGAGGGQAMPDGTVPEPGGWNRFQLEVDDIGPRSARLARPRRPVSQRDRGRRRRQADPGRGPRREPGRAVRAYAWRRPGSVRSVAAARAPHLARSSRIVRNLPFAARPRDRGRSCMWGMRYMPLFAGGGSDGRLSMACRGSTPRRPMAARRRAAARESSCSGAGRRPQSP